MTTVQLRAVCAAFCVDSQWLVALRASLLTTPAIET